MRMNLKSRAVELRTSKHTTDSGALQKGADFLRAFTLGFDIDDAIALLRLDDLYIETFEIKDVKSLQGEHLGRAIGRIAGKDGKTKFAIENASRTRVVLADAKVHILGGFKNIHVAREAVVSLILGSPPGKVYGNLRTVSLVWSGRQVGVDANVITGCEPDEGTGLLNACSTMISRESTVCIARRLGVIGSLAFICPTPRGILYCTAAGQGSVIS